MGQWAASTVIAAMAGLGAGVAVCLWWARRSARMRKRIPRHWPLDLRALANTEELRVLRWLSRSFFDHHVMIKIPVTRFTMPRQQAQGSHWYQLLSGVYCTFTVCSAEGRVVGCVDVPGQNGISRSNRQLKLALLTQCGVAYSVLKPGKLPTLVDIRTEFLGEMAALPRDPKRERDEALVTAAHTRLRAAIDRQRNSRSSDMAPLGDSQPAPLTGPDSRTGEDSNFSGGWQEQNSFIAPLDSRSGELS